MKKNNYKLLLGMVVGVLISATTVYAAKIVSTNVTYDNSRSKLSSTTVQGALDELSEKAKNSNSTSSNFVIGYEYSTSTATKCITGDENTCVPTTCYKDTSTKSCNTGTIIKYRVNNMETKVFYVIQDNGPTLTMLQRENLLMNVVPGSGMTFQILSMTKLATDSWSNTNYSYLSYSQSTSKTYKLQARPLYKAEAEEVFGCSETTECKYEFLYNYLYNSVGSVADFNSENQAYWLLVTDGIVADSVSYDLAYTGRIYKQSNPINAANIGIRVVVNVNKD